MTLSNSAVITRARALRGVRGEIDDRVGSKADVVGSMVGLKLRAGRATQQLGVTYFVRNKLPKSEIAPRRRVPTRLRVGSAFVATDVVEWPLMAEQALPTATILFDGRLQGTLSCFGVSEAGTFGVTCAHCLTGVDGNPATPTAVAAYVNPPGQFVPVGQSVYLAYAPGTGGPSNFGYLDCGLFDLRDQVLAARAASGVKLELVTDTLNLIGHHLVGVSALNAPHSSGQRRNAQVIGVDANALGERCDLVLSVEPPGTFRGDSGMLWLTEHGQAAAIHARGEVMSGMHGSRLTTAMSAHRLPLALGVQLVIG